MSKAHVATMKKAVSTYYAAAKDAAEKIKRNNSIYLPDSAKSENNRVRKALEEKRREATQAILEAQEAGKAEAESWGQLDGSKITDDAKLLQMDIAPAEFNKLVERYRDNGTMSAMLYKYGEAHNAAAKKDNPLGFGPFDISKIPTTQRKQQAIDTFAKGALDIVSRADGNTNSALFDIAVEQYGEPSALSAQLFEVL